jgi:hypothetical protein
MSSSDVEIEERLSRSLRAWAGHLPEEPPVPWRSVHASAVRSKRTATRHRYGTLGLAASIVVVAVTTLLWASPSAGARYDQGGQPSAGAAAGQRMTAANGAGLPQSGHWVVTNSAVSARMPAFPDPYAVVPSSSQEAQSDD